MTAKPKVEVVLDEDRNKIEDEEILGLLDQNHPCILSISREGKGPIATPVWYEYKDDKFVFGIFPNSAKGKLLQRNRRATITVQRPVEPYQFVMVEGEVRAVPNEELAEQGETVWSVMRSIFGRYIDADVADGYAAILPTLAPDYTIFELVPVRVRGESIPKHADIMPKMEDVPGFIQALEEGLTLEQARAKFGLYVKPGRVS